MTREVEPSQSADLIRHLRARVAELEAGLAQTLQREADANAAAFRHKARADAAEAALERDRSFVAETINGVHSAIQSREWLLEGRGSYEWDDDRYRDEFGQAIEAIRGPIDSLRAIAADWSNCPTDPEKIQAARAITPPADLIERAKGGA